jgi:type I restriction-modification system DNA methylase subunit
MAEDILNKIYKLLASIDLMSRPEIRFSLDLRDLLESICSRGPIGGLKLKVLMGEPKLDGKTPDIVVVRELDGVPVLIIETKRKTEKGFSREFSPYSPSVIAQALSYAALAKDNFNIPATPLFATANPDVIVLFGPVDDPWSFLDRDAVSRSDYSSALSPQAYMRLASKYYVFDEEGPLREELAFKLLDTSVKLWLKEVEVQKVRKEIGFWLIDQLRYFVDFMDRYFVRGPLLTKLRWDQDFHGMLDGYAREIGYSNGLADIVGRNLERVENLSRMMIYVLMNKIIFYKVLEYYYKLPELKPFASEVKSSKDYLQRLNEFFNDAMKTSRDFEQIFCTGLYDHIVISDDERALFQIDELIRTLSGINLQEFGDVIGHVYENLIPEEERHRLGQFYTPRPIAELITTWCIRSGDDVVLGPGCGSGTFEVEAYWRLVEFKTGRRTIPPRSVHDKVLNQIYAIDINSFPAQLTSVNLAMKNILAPATNLNVIESDFFSIIPGQEVLLPYKVQTPEGPKEKRIYLPKEGFDAVFGNPPYTRWTEIPQNVRENIRNRLKKELSDYNLHADVGRGREPGIYVYFIMWAKEFLKPGGRLGMIISDSWLQADYGSDFFKFMLDNYDIYAIIDISARVFPVPLIGTCIVLLEKPSNRAERRDNKVVFAYLDVSRGTIDVDEILKFIEDVRNKVRTEKPVVRDLASGARIMARAYAQKDLVGYEGRIINLIFGAEDVLDLLEQSPLIRGLSEYFKPARGNTVWSVWAISHGRRPDIGGEGFFYFTEERARQLGIPQEFLHPLLPSSRYMKNFTFTQEDWEELRRRDAECYLFLCHRQRNDLPESVIKYIQLGEGPNAQIRLRRRPGEAEGRPINESQASQARLEHRDIFFDWYDLGGVVESPIYVTYGSQYWTRFVLARYQCALDHRILALIPKEGVKFDEVELKALLAYLNSSFSQLQAEIRGRSTGGGMIELDVNSLSNFLILDVKKLPRGDLEKLAQLFDKLETETRKLGGADRVESVFGSELAKELTGRSDVREGITGLFNTVIKDIDHEVERILGLEDIVESARAMVLEMARRRLSRAGEARRGAIRGSEEIPEIERPRGRRGRGGNTNRTLNE